MFRRLLLIDLVLVALLVFGGLRIRKDWLAFWTTHRIENIQAAADAISAPPSPAVPASLNLSDWTEIAARNPFSFDRTDTPIIATQTAADQVEPKPILFGTMSLGKDSLAMMTSGKTEGRIARPLHVGESLDGWELVEIQEKSVVMRSGARRENVIMNDPTAQIPRGAERTANGATGSVVQTAPAVPTAGSNTVRPPAPTPSTIGGPPPLPPAPVDANGQPKKGRWVRSPFGDVFVEEDR